MGYPEETEDLSKFFPTTTLVTAQDIIFFWVARMVMLSKKTMNNIPFSKVLINGIVRDDEGKKMSKSSNNGVDPIEIIEKYGADALRFSLLLGNGTGNDFRFSETKILEDRKFINKVFNSGKFLELCMSQTTPVELDKSKLNIFDKWIYTKMQNAIDDITKHMNALDVCQAVNRMYDFVWDDFCDYYIELTKPYVYNEDPDIRAHAVAVLKDVYINVLKLLHPIIPFITEDIYSNFATGFLMEQHYASSIGEFETEKNQVEAIIDLIQKIREVRLNLDVAPAKRISLVINSNKTAKDSLITINASSLVLSKMVNIDKIEIVDSTPENIINFMTELGEFYFYKNEVVDTEKERARLTKDIEKISSEMTLLGSRLANPNFVNKAPAELVKKEQDRFNFLKQSLDSLEVKLNELN